MTGRRFDHLRLDQVSRRFGDKVVLDSLDLQISGGEFVALLGPSGCGKSTALNCLAGLLPLRGTGREETRRRVHEALRLVQLTPYADRLPGQLSGGQQQRVAIARAIVIEPPLVLMDEPLSNLDAALRLDMRTEIRRLHQSLGLTTVYVTHDQEEALSLADRLVVLREGVVQQVGTPEELYRSPNNPHVAGFMGYRNLLPMTVTKHDGELVTVNGYGIELTGLARGDFGTGPATVAIRPEDFVVGQPPAEQAGNHFEVGIEVVEYHGREQAIQARLPEGQALRLRSSTRVARGEVVSAWVPRDRVLVYGEQLDGPPVEEAAGPSTGVATNPAPSTAGAPS
ncbi:MAG: spermidine/putrescine ABC transporter ATP-binding protein [Actinobacteria bacterium 13_2_20CM_2_71_6]|nr:MAG: spermidine/putrescine ABC transporter ATP-binding protein [Actinobacteria bacterium 13_2_20CM_2_71_6]